MTAGPDDDNALFRDLAAYLTIVMESAGAGGILAHAVADADDVRSELTDDALVAFTAACQRLAVWSQLMQSHALVDLVHRWDGPSRTCDISKASVIAEVALATGMSEWAVGQRVVVALGVPDLLPQVSQLFEAGTLDFDRVKVIFDAVDGLPPDAAAKVEAAILDIAVNGKIAALRTALAKAILTYAPEVAAARAEASAKRRAVRFSKAEDSAAVMVVEAPATRIAQAEASLNLLAQAAIDAAGEDDDRTVDAVRADVVLDLIENAADALQQEATVEDEPGQESETGEPAPRPAAGKARRVRGRTQVNVTLPLSTILGLNDEPGYLAGYGPIPAQMAREVATHGTWRCAVTEDRAGKVHGTLLGLGKSTFSPGYVPKQTTWRYVTTRDGTCTFPGCQRQAMHTDLDHRVRYRDGGATCECNLAATCRRHHRLKHETPLRVSATGDDGTTWTTRTGREYHSPAPTLPHAPAPRRVAEPPPF